MEASEECGALFVCAAVTSDEDNDADGFFEQPARKIYVLTDPVNPA